MKKQLLDKDKLLTYLYHNYNTAIAKINEAKEMDIEYVMDATIKNLIKIIIKRIEKGVFDINAEEKE